MYIEPIRLWRLISLYFNPYCQWSMWKILRMNKQILPLFLLLFMLVRHNRTPVHSLVCTYSPHYINPPSPQGTSFLRRIVWRLDFRIDTRTVIMCICRYNKSGACRMSIMVPLGASSNSRTNQGTQGFSKIKRRIVCVCNAAAEQRWSSSSPRVEIDCTWLDAKRKKGGRISKQARRRQSRSAAAAQWDRSIVFSVLGVAV